MQILKFKPHPWCSASNAIRQQWLANTQSESQLRCSTLLFSALLSWTLLYRTPTVPLLYFYSTSASTSALLCCTATPTPTSTSTLLYSTLSYSALIYSALLYSSLLCSTLLYTTLLYSTLLYSTLLYLYSLSLRYLCSTSRRGQLDTRIFGLVRMWLHDLLIRHMPTGHNDLLG